jgi:hypothetical protein
MKIGSNQCYNNAMKERRAYMVMRARMEACKSVTI